MAAMEFKERRQARRSLEAFTTYTMPSFEVAWHNQLLAGYLDRFARGEIKRLMLNLPPRHGKSELASRRLPAFLLGTNPDTELIAVSYSADLAGRMNRDVQRIIDSPAYSRLFPETKLSGKNVRTDALGSYVRNSDMFEIPGHRGSYRSAGIGGGIVGMGFTKGIIDDYCKNREEADSPTVRESIWEWYISTFYPRRAKDAGILITATRWHEDDLCGRLLRLAAEDSKADQWTVLRLPAICEEAGRPGDPRKPGEALWPSCFPLEDLEKTRANSAYEWSSQYQQHPRPEGGTEWPAEFFGPHIWFDDFPAIDWRCKVLSLDPSKGKADKSGDYSAFIDLRVDNDLCLWIDADLDNVRPVESMHGGRSIAGDGVTLARAIQPSAIVVETNGFQELVALTLRRYLQAAGLLSCPLFTICNTQPKQTRIRTLGTYLAQRRFRVRNTRGGRLLVQQLRDFPVGLHDDGCFVAGTMIETLTGPMPIERVRKGDYVLTRRGYAQVVASGCTGLKDVIEVTASNGRRLVGTANHPVFDGIAFTPMRYVSTMTECENTSPPNPKRLSLTASPSGVIRNRINSLTGCISHRTPRIEEMASGRCIKRFGKRLTEAFRRDATSTTKTATHLTTHSQISNASANPSMMPGIGSREATAKKLRKDVSNSHLPNAVLENGISRLKDVHGIPNTGDYLGKVEPRQQSYARNAASHFRRSHRSEPNSAQAVAANAPIRTTVDMRSVFVSGIKNAGKKLVYNLSVAGDHEYIANGFVVHNCDALKLAEVTADYLLTGRRDGSGRPQVLRA